MTLRVVVARGGGDPIIVIARSPQGDEAISKVRREIASLRSR
jgi:hypothetical protein